MINDNIFSRQVKKYDNWYDINKSAYLSEIEALNKVKPDTGKGVEIGIGTGRFARPLNIHLGIDPSLEMLKLAQKRGVHVIRAKGEYLPFHNGSFDYLTIINALCFVKDAGKVLVEARRVLKEKGKIILGIIDRKSFLGKFYREKKSKFYRQANFFRVEKLTVLLETIGFKNFSYSQTIFQFPEKINAVEVPQTGFGRGGFVIIVAQK